jgi:hypothetical protein
MTDPVTPDEILAYLDDVDYPADRAALVASAGRAGAPEAVLRRIRAVAPVEYRNRAEAAWSVRVDPAVGRSAGHAAAQTRADAPSGIAERVWRVPTDRVNGVPRRMG